MCGFFVFENNHKNWKAITYYCTYWLSFLDNFVFVSRERKWWLRPMQFRPQDLFPFQIHQPTTTICLYFYSSLSPFDCNPIRMLFQKRSTLHSHTFFLKKLTWLSNRCRFSTSNSRKNVVCQSNHRTFCWNEWSDMCKKCYQSNLFEINTFAAIVWTAYQLDCSFSVVAKRSIIWNESWIWTKFLQWISSVWNVQPIFFVCQLWSFVIQINCRNAKTQKAIGNERGII